MRSVPMFVAALALSLLAAPALAFDVQNGGASGTGGANLTPDADAAAAAGVSLDTDLRSQLGLPGDDKTTAGTATKSGLQFGVTGGGTGSFNTTTMGYDERPWVAPRSRPGSN